MMSLTILGGGNTAFAAAANLSLRGFQVTINDDLCSAKGSAMLIRFRLRSIVPTVLIGLPFCLAPVNEKHTSVSQKADSRTVFFKT